MKGQLLIVCAVLVVISSIGVCYGKSSPKAAAVQPKASLSRQGPKVSAQNVKQPNSGSMMNDATKPAVSPIITMPAPATAGAGPSMPVVTTPTTPGTGVAVGSLSTTPSTGVAVDGNYVYVLQEGKLYRFAKGDVNECGTTVPPAGTICPPTGAGPSCVPGICGPGMSYIPGMTSTSLTVKTYTPCVNPCPPPCPTGAGPTTCAPACPTPCPTTCPPPSCGPVSEVSCGSSCAPVPCPPPACPKTDECGNPIATQPSYTTTTTTVPAGPGTGPCAPCPIGTISACAQQTIDCLNKLCGVDVDRAYLQAVIQLNLQILAVSDAAVVHLGTTSLQNYATNSIDDARSNVSKAQGWLRTKYCLTIAACSSGAPTCFDICKWGTGGAFDEAYKDQVIQYYLDEIAISQVELERGLDCKVKEFAAQTIRNNQERITRLRRCGACGYT